MVWFNCITAFRGNLDDAAFARIAPTSAELMAIAALRPASMAQHGGCPFTVRMYASTARAGRPRWDALDIPNVICTLELKIARLGRGQEDTLSALTHPADVLGESLAPGRYYVGAFVRPNRDSLVLDAGTVDLHPLAGRRLTRACTRQAGRAQA
jgi:hypothetical protein